MKKTILIPIAMLLFCCNQQTAISCNSENENKSNTFVARDKVEITLPEKFYVKGTIIYNSEDEKIGEIPPFFTPLKNISFLEYLEMYKKNEGEIEIQEGEAINFAHGMDEDLPDIIKIDSVQFADYKWYYTLEKIWISDGYSHSWINLYNFKAFENDKIFTIHFYDTDTENDNSDYFIDIIKTVKIR
jgi:hypothetical protein